ncbi:MAG: phage protease, partial [Gammaproteobacteria bacterium]|nr:phage protease [Gammaproteobacteria bacterium]
DADEDAVCKAVGELAQKANGGGRDEGKALASVAKALGLKDDASAEDIERAAAKATADAAKAGDAEDLAKRLAKIEDKNATKAAEAKAEAAIKEGKLTPAQRDWAIGYARRDPEGFDAFVDKQPVIVASGGGGGVKPPKGSDGLNQEEAAVCKAMGLDPEAFKKTRDAERAEED